MMPPAIETFAQCLRDYADELERGAGIEDAETVKLAVLELLEAGHLDPDLIDEGDAAAFAFLLSEVALRGLRVGGVERPESRDERLGLAVMGPH